MGTFLLLLFIFFIVIPALRIAYALFNVRRKMRDTMRQMYDAQQQASGQGTQQKRKAGWSAPGQPRKKIGKDVGEYVRFEEIPAAPTAGTDDGTGRRFAGSEPQITDADWEDIK